MNYLPVWPLDITPHIAFGLMLIIGSIGGYAAHKISWLPSITGFMLVGFLAGPSGLGLLSYHMISEARILIDIALALILYRLGLSLDLKMLWRSPGLIFASLLESLATFGVVFYLLTLFGVPTVLCVLIAAISISSSPAVLLHVAHEVGAKGVATETGKTLVALNNLLSFVAFSAALSMLLYSSGFNWSTVFFQPLYTLLGSTVLGIVLGLSLHAIAQRTHSATQYKLALVIGTIMVAIGLANELKLSMLFCALVIGIVVKSIERESMVSDIQFGPSFELFFIVLFVFAGAGLHMKELLDFAPLVLALVVARSLAKVLGVAGITALYRRPLRKGIASGMLLIPMAGLAIGLALTASNMFPEHASMISAIVLGAVAVFETMGPPIATFAFRFAGEANEGPDDEDADDESSDEEAEQDEEDDSAQRIAHTTDTQAPAETTASRLVAENVAALSAAAAALVVTNTKGDKNDAVKPEAVKEGVAKEETGKNETPTEENQEDQVAIGLVSPTQIIKNKKEEAIAKGDSPVQNSEAVANNTESAATATELNAAEMPQEKSEPDTDKKAEKKTDQKPENKSDKKSEKKPEKKSEKKAEEKPEKPANQLFHEEHELPEDDEAEIENAKNKDAEKIELESEGIDEKTVADEQAAVVEETEALQLDLPDEEEPAKSVTAPVSASENISTAQPQGSSAEVDTEASSSVDLVDRALNSISQSPADRMDVIAKNVPAPTEVNVVAVTRQPIWQKAAQKTKQLFGQLSTKKDKPDV